MTQSTDSPRDWPFGVNLLPEYARRYKDIRNNNNNNRFSGCWNTREKDITDNSSSNDNSTIMRDNINMLTDDILTEIFMYLNEMHDKYNAGRVSKRWNKVMNRSLQSKRAKTRFVPRIGCTYWLEIDRVPFEIGTCSKNKGFLAIRKYLYRIPDGQVALRMRGESVSMLDLNLLHEDLGAIIAMLRMFTQLRQIQMTGGELDVYLCEILPSTVDTIINVDPTLFNLASIGNRLRKLSMVNPRRYCDIESILASNQSLHSITVLNNALFKFRALFSLGVVSRPYESLRELAIGEEIVNIQFTRDLLPVLQHFPNLCRLQAWHFDFKNPSNTELLRNLQRHTSLRELILHNMIGAHFHNITRFFRRLPVNLRVFVGDIGESKQLIAHLLIDYLANNAVARSINIVRSTEDHCWGAHFGRDNANNAVIMLTDATFSHPVRKIGRPADHNNEGPFVWKQAVKVKLSLEGILPCNVTPRYYWYSSGDTAVRYTEWRRRTHVNPEELAPIMTYLASHPESLTHVLPLYS